MKHISAAKSKQAAHLAQQAREILELKEQLQALEKRRNELKVLAEELGRWLFVLQTNTMELIATGGGGSREAVGS